MRKMKVRRGSDAERRTSSLLDLAVRLLRYERRTGAARSGSRTLQSRRLDRFRNRDWNARPRRCGRTRQHRWLPKAAWSARSRGGCVLERDGCELPRFSSREFRSRVRAGGSGAVRRSRDGSNAIRRLRLLFPALVGTVSRSDAAVEGLAQERLRHALGTGRPLAGRGDAAARRGGAA